MECVFFWGCFVCGVGGFVGVDLYIGDLIGCCKFFV